MAAHRVYAIGSSDAGDLRERIDLHADNLRQGRLSDHGLTGTGLSTTIGLLPNDLYTLAVEDCGGTAATTTFQLTGYQQTSATYTGKWTTTTFVGAWGGTATYSTAKNASATFTCDCDGIALVTDGASTHGSAQVYIDGVLKATINTQSSTNTNRVVIFKDGWSTDATHTIKIVNLATSGHPRISIDGLITRTTS